MCAHVSSRNNGNSKKITVETAMLWYDNSQLVGFFPLVHVCSYYFFVYLGPQIQFTLGSIQRVQISMQVQKRNK